MPRRNHRPHHGGHHKVHVKGAPPPVPVEQLVIPRGKCFRASRAGKLRFTEADAAEALRQAQAKRARSGSAHSEERVYECKVADGGCGDWHLTSRKTWTPR